MESVALTSRLAGAVWGHLIGDAMGVPYEFKRPEKIRSVHWGAKGTHAQPPGTWSDDGAMMLATLDSLLAAGFDPQDQGRRFLHWFDRGEYTPDGGPPFDFGQTTAEAMDRLRRGTPALNAGGASEHDNGNGSLMRILPVALVGRDLVPDVLMDEAQSSSRITHGHAWSQVTCALYTLVAQALLHDEEPAEALEHSLALLRSRYEEPDADPAFAPALARVVAHEDREGRGFVVDAFWSAWDAFTAGDSYQDVIERAIRYGNDTDTTACIAGGLAGIRWGIEGIPRGWADSMRGHDVVDPLVERLVATVAPDEDE